MRRLIFHKLRGELDAAVTRCADALIEGDSIAESALRERIVELETERDELRRDLAYLMEPAPDLDSASARLAAAARALVDVASRQPEPCGHGEPG